MAVNSKKNFSKVPFYSHALEAGTFTLHLLVDTSDISLVLYSINDSSFSHAFEVSNVNSQTVNITVPVQEGDVVYWKGCGSRYNNNTPNYNNDVFESTGLYEVGGDLMSLVCPDLTSLYANDFPTVIEAYCFRNFFRNETKLVSCDDLVISATTCKQEGCKRLFYGCTSLVNPIKVLPATTIERQCYHTMFSECSNLVSTPELHAIRTAYQSFFGMFDNCVALMAASKLSATILDYSCYNSMFKNCTSLTKAPELLAATLGQYSYDHMFEGCSSLNYIKAIFTTTPTLDTSNSWVKNVAATGIFVKHIDATWHVRGVNGVPNNWTIIYFDPSTEKYYLSDKTTECDDHGNVINA